MMDQADSNSDEQTARKQALSALIDGESSAAGVDRLCADWRAHADVRETWHAYSVIGDVLRSGDLASSAAHDLQFLGAFRARMASEPVVLAPEPVAPSRDVPVAALSSPMVRRSRARTWAVPASVAAGFLVVAGAMMVVQVPGVVDDAPARMASAPAGVSGATIQVGQNQTVDTASEAYPAEIELVFDGQVIRDPRLDRYLLAHKQFSGSSVLGPASGLMRSAAAEVPAR